MIAKVKIWNNLVGIVYWDKNRNIGVFEYDSSFVDKELEVSPLLMPVKEGVIYDFPALNFETFKGLPPMIADSLPDDFGNHIMNTWLSQQGKTIDDLLPTERLGYVGKRGMGALEYEPVLDKSEEYTSDINLEELVNIANKVLASKNSTEFQSIDSNALSKILRIGTSAGGARAKAILAFDEKNRIYKPGDIIHDENHSYWLLKLDGVSDKQLGDPKGYGKIEYAYYNMAKECGIEMSLSKLLHEHDRAHFITKRFDRTDEGGKVHLQTLSGLTGMNYKQANMYSYEQVFTVLRQLRLPHKSIEQQFRRMVFNIVARNQDDHVKNISFLMDKTGAWSLSPAYDLTYSHNPVGTWTNKHQLSVSGKRDEFTIDDLLKVGKENNIRNRKSIISDIVEVVSNWKQFAQNAEIEQDRIKDIESNHRIITNKNQ